MNFFSVASLALYPRLARPGRRSGRWPGRASAWAPRRSSSRWPSCRCRSTCGAGCLASLPAMRPGRKREGRLADVWPSASVFGLIVGLAALVLVAQGAGVSAYDDILRFGRALATDTLARAERALAPGSAGSPATPTRRASSPGRSGRRTTWSGGRTGCWPLWLAAAPCVDPHLAVRPERLGRASRWSPPGRSRRASRSCCPGLYWAALLPVPTPGIALRRRGRAGRLPRSRSDRARRFRSRGPRSAGSSLLAAILGTAFHPGPRLPAGPAAGADGPLQGRRTVGVPADAGPGARPSLDALGASDALRLGLAEPPALLRQARRRHAGTSSSTTCSATRPSATIR